MDPGHDDPLPPYTYVPGGRWPHPISAAEGHSAGMAHAGAAPIPEGDWRGSPAYVRGVRLFNAGYYWEAHEVWEGLWHAHGRRGPTADMLKALIKLAAAGVKAREGQAHGVRTHARRAADLFAAVRAEVGPSLLGLDLAACEAASTAIADRPSVDPRPKDAPAAPSLGCRIDPA